MRQTLLFLFTLLVTIILNVVAHSLQPPLNLVEFVNITLLLFFFFFGISGRTLLAVIFLGIFKDALANYFLGTMSLIYIFSFIIIIALRNTLFTHQTQISWFFLIVIFNIIYWFGLFLFFLNKLVFSFLIFQEVLISIMFTSLLTFSVCLCIQFIQNQYKKKFL
jgi:hypothetical protein